jgi:hypothetical protein
MKRKVVSGFLVIVMLLFHRQRLVTIPDTEFHRHTFNNIREEAYILTRPPSCALVLYENNA